jgi:hypothetical protein
VAECTSRSKSITNAPTNSAMKDFSQEIIDNLLDLLDQTSLSRLARASHEYQRVVEPTLYRTFVYKPYSYMPPMEAVKTHHLIRTSKERPDLRVFVRHVDVNGQCPIPRRLEETLSIVRNSKFFYRLLLHQLRSYQSHIHGEDEQLPQRHPTAPQY